MEVLAKQADIRIVPMNADHLDEIAEIERQCFSMPWSRRMLAEELDNHCAAFLAAVTPEGQVVGYAGLLVVADEGYITNIAVRAEWRQRRIATQLLEVFVRFAEANRLAFLTLEVRPSNTAAILLYGRHGFREAGRRKNYYDLPKEDALIMTRYFGQDEGAEA